MKFWGKTITLTAAHVFFAVLILEPLTLAQTGGGSAGGVTINLKPSDGNAPPENGQNSSSQHKSLSSPTNSLHAKELLPTAKLASSAVRILRH